MAVQHSRVQLGGLEDVAATAVLKVRRLVGVATVGKSPAGAVVEMEVYSKHMATGHMEASSALGGKKIGPILSYVRPFEFLLVSECGSKERA